MVKLYQYLLNASKWGYLAIAILYLKQFFFEGPEYKLLHLDDVSYIPIVLLLWIYCFSFWHAVFESKDLTDKIMFSIFLSAGLAIPIVIYCMNKDISISLPLIFILIEPLKNKIQNGKTQAKSDMRNIILVIISIAVLFLSAILAAIFNKGSLSPRLYGFLLFATLFYFNDRINAMDKNYRNSMNKYDD